MHRHPRLLAAALTLAALINGCGRHRDTTPPATFGTADNDYVLAIVLDLSGSFQHMMAEDGKAYDFVMEVLSRYLRDRSGTHDRIILAQISGTNQALLYEGSVTDLRRDFNSASKFRDFLLQKAVPGSLVHDGIRSTIDYLLSDSRIARGKVKSGVFVLSDFLDGGPDPVQSERKLVSSLTDYARTGGVIGCYFVNQLKAPIWRTHLKDAGFREFCLECEINGRPPLPNLER